MKKSTKIWLNVVLFVAMIGYIVAASILYSDNKAKCGEFVVQIMDSNVKFVTRDVVLSAVDSAGLTPIGRYRDDIEIGKIEKLLSEFEYVDSVEVHTDIDARCVAVIRQKMPKIRLANSIGQDFYVTQEGELLVPVDDYNHNVRTINGNFLIDIDSSSLNKLQKKDEKVTANLKKLINFVQIVQNDQFINDLIVQIWVDSTWKIELVPAVGEQIIKFGTMFEMKEKIDKLSKFYKQKFADGWWKNTKIVNVEFKNQIIIQ